MICNRVWVAVVSKKPQLKWKFKINEHVSLVLAVSINRYDREMMISYENDDDGVDENDDDDDDNDSSSTM